MVVRSRAGVATTFDFREKAPLGSTPKMYLKEDGSIDQYQEATSYEPRK